MGYHDNPPYFLTAYDIAVKWGFRGTEQEWLNSLTAFSLAQEAGFSGTVEEWLADLIDPVPDLQIGNVETLPGGSQATASIRGDKKNPILDLGIPRGQSSDDSLPKVGGKMKGDIDMDGHAIQNLPEPQQEGDASPKSYVDERLKKDGSEAMEGELDMDGHAIQNLPEPQQEGDASPKSYVDKRLKKDGSEAMEGDLDMGNNQITNVAAPTEEGHAVNKEYADSLADGLHKFFTVSLPVSGWSGAEPYTQTVAVPGILAEDHPHWDVVLSDDNDTAIAERDAFAVVDDLDAAANSVIFTCLEEKPEVDLTIQLEVSR